MSAISAFDASGAPSGAANAYSQLNSEDFVKIMLTELSNQDPLEPSDTSALLDQMANLRTIQGNIDLGDRMEALVAQNELASAATLIGTRVSGLSETLDSVEGVVRSVVRTDEGPILTLEDGSLMRMSNLLRIDDQADQSTGDAS